MRDYHNLRYIRDIFEGAENIHIIRGDIGFDGFLICDDLSMKALKGDFADLTAQALDAGCDAVLHCNGDMAEMAKIASAVRPLSDKAMERGYEVKVTAKQYGDLTFKPGDKKQETTETEDSGAEEESDHPTTAFRVGLLKYLHAKEHPLN